MQRGPITPSGYRAMWLFVMFDLPMRSKTDRKTYARFRKHLISEGFSGLQYSVYARYFESEEATRACRRRVAERVPEDGRVRVLHVTETQFASMSVFLGKREQDPEKPPDQLLLF